MGVLKMSLTKVFVLVAVAGALLLMDFKSFKANSLKSLQGLMPVIVLVAAVLEAVMVFNLMKISFLGGNAFLILGGALAVGGALILKSVSGRTMTAAATLVTFVGALQLLGAFNIIPRI
jgi:hypothetical protein